MAKGITSIISKSGIGDVLGLESKSARLKAQRVGAEAVAAEKAQAAEAAELAKTEKAAAAKEAAATLETKQAESRRQALSGLLLTGEGEEPSRRRFLKGAK